MIYGHEFPIEYQKIFEFVPNYKNISLIGQKLKIGNFCTLKGDSDLLKALKNQIKILPLIENNMIYDQGREIWIVSPIIEFPSDFRRIFYKLKIKFKIDCKTLNYDNKSFKLWKISHRKNKNVVEILNSEIKTNADGEIFLTANLTHFCMVFICLSNSEVQEVFNENMNNHHLERTCEKILDNQFNFGVEDIRNCVNHGFNFRGRFDECLRWAYSENCPQNLFNCNKIALACVRLYTSNFYKELNKNLRNFNDYENWISYIIRMKPVLKGIVKGLKQMEFFWGTVYRGVETKDDRFKKGMYVRFQEFLSCSKSKNTHFMEIAKTKFIIKSKTGRSIESIAVIPEEEEVLFMPGTTFFIYKTNTTIFQVDEIYMEEVCLPFGEQKLLWVDDKPEGNKHLMMDQERKGISVFWRNSTKEALDILTDEGRFLLNIGFDNFKIVTDMVRKENGGENVYAGASLINELRNSRYNGDIAVFCHDVEMAIQNCQKLGVNDDSVKFFASIPELNRYLDWANLHNNELINNEVG